MLDQLLGGNKDQIISDLCRKLGVDPSKAGDFLQQGLALLGNAFKSGKIDMSALMSGSPSGVLSKLDLSSLSGLVGGDTGKARMGMESVVGPVMNAAKSNAGGVEQLLGQLAGAGSSSGVMGQVAGVASKLFGKKS